MVKKSDLREIVLDIETTGLSHAEGHRITEIGCVELINHMPTENHFHVYINPEREVGADSVAITGLTNEFLKDKPIFKFIVDDFFKFIGPEDRLIIHNASFDIGFINAELSRLGIPKINESRVVDTLRMARLKFPGSPASLDALCRRFKIDLSDREKHGALIDSLLLSGVYLELLGGRQLKLGVESKKEQKNGNNNSNKDILSQQKTNFPTRSFDLTAEEISAHKEFIYGIPNNAWEKSCV